MQVSINHRTGNGEDDVIPLEFDVPDDVWESVENEGTEEFLIMGLVAGYTGNSLIENADDPGGEYAIVRVGYEIGRKQMKARLIETSQVQLSYVDGKPTLPDGPIMSGDFDLRPMLEKALSELPEPKTEKKHFDVPETIEKLANENGCVDVLQRGICVGFGRILGGMELVPDENTHPLQCQLFLWGVALGFLQREQ